MISIKPQNEIIELRLTLFLRVVKNIVTLKALVLETSKTLILETMQTLKVVKMQALILEISTI
jgi:hypothetical protein